MDQTFSYLLVQRQTWLTSYLYTMLYVKTLNLSHTDIYSVRKHSTAMMLNMVMTLLLVINPHFLLFSFYFRLASGLSLDLSWWVTSLRHKIVRKYTNFYFKLL